MESLFSTYGSRPLADRMRPDNFDIFVGQSHIIGQNRVLYDMINNGRICSMIFWGPPGVGKTTLANIIAKKVQSNFIEFSAVNSSIKDVRDVMQKAEDDKRMGINTIVFVDEIHRFSKSQQDAFLPFVERGSIILIGATTENPSFEINNALLSRLKVFVFKQLTHQDISVILKNALTSKNGLGNFKITISDDIIDIIAKQANGDARYALSTLEMVIMNSHKDHQGNIVIDNDILNQCISYKMPMYDKNGELHFDLISALHKSMRNSDPDAAVYWLARMLEAGEDPLYIARRLIRFASEDIGLAATKALELAVNTYTACHYIGVPECNVVLTQTVVYMSLAPKSNSMYIAYERAKQDAIEHSNESVPLNIRNAPTKLMQQLHYGEGYKYAHLYKDGITNMKCLPENLLNRQYYIPTDNGDEKRCKNRLEWIKTTKKNF